MKYNNTIQLFKTIAKIVNDPTILIDKLLKSENFNGSNNFNLNNSMNSNIYLEPENSNIEYNKSATRENSTSSEYNNSGSNSCYNKQQDTSSNPQGIIDSISQELTSVRLKQAIILSEIVGKPRSKTRKKRRS